MQQGQSIFCFFCVGVVDYDQVVDGVDLYYCLVEVVEGVWQQ